MFFSIIVPIYNVEQYLCECIESVINQTFKDWELILVDDGSPDRCPQICEEYAHSDNRIKVVHKPNGGLVSARKAGLEVALGEYAVCLDGDDFLHKDCLSKVYRQIEKHTPDVVCFGMIFYSNLEVRREITGYRYGFYDKELMDIEVIPRFLHSKSAQRFPPTACSKAIKMELYRKYQMKVPNDVSMGEDGACIYPLVGNANSLFIMQECLYYYRQFPTSMSKVQKPLLWDNYDKIFALYAKEIDLDKNDLSVQYNRARTHNLFNITMSQFYQKLPYSDIVAAIEKRFEEHPEYSASIKGSDFSSIQMKFARWALENKKYRLLQIYAVNKTKIVFAKAILKKLHI